MGESLANVRRSNASEAAAAIVQPAFLDVLLQFTRETSPGATEEAPRSRADSGTTKGLSGISMDSIGGKLVCSIKSAVARGIMLCLILCATTQAWADETFITDEKTLVFPDPTLNLSDLGTTYYLRARFGGGWVDCKRAETMAFLLSDKSNSTKKTYQFQSVDESHPKCVEVEFTKGEDGIYAQAMGIYYANEDPTKFGTQLTTASNTPQKSTGKEAGSMNDDGYGIYDLQLVKPLGESDSINVNFKHGDNDNLTGDSTSCMGAGNWIVPYSRWTNIKATSCAMSGTPTPTNITLQSGETVTVSVKGTRGSHTCNKLSTTYDLRSGYVDETSTSGKDTPTVIVTNIPYDNYRVVVFMATDSGNYQFGYVTINGVDYTSTYTNTSVNVGASYHSTVKGSSNWGHAGASNTAKGLAEGINYLVSPVTSGETATITAHKGTDARGCIAAIQIVKVGTISSSGNYAIDDLFGPISDGMSNLTVDVSESATLSIDSTNSLSSVTFNVAEGKTLTLIGSEPTESAIVVNGNVICSATITGAISIISGSLKLTDGAATSGSEVSVASESTFEIGYACTWSGVISGAGGVKISADAVTLSAANSFASGLTVKSGGRAKSGNGTGFGQAQGTLTVESGGSLDLKNTAASKYKLNIAGTGINNSGAVYSTENISYGSAQTQSITLSGDATIKSDSDYPWGLINGGYAATTINLGTYTLTKAGTGSFWLCNATINGTGSIVVSGGTMYTIKTQSAGNNATLRIASGATFNMNSGPNSAAVANFSIGNIQCDSGATLSVASGKTLTVKSGGSIGGTVSGTGNIILDGGTMDIASAVPCKITVNAGATVNANGTFALSGSNKIDSGATLNITGGNVTLTTNGSGDGIKGTVNIENGSTLTVNTGDALWYGASAGNGIVNVKSNGTLAMGSTRWTLGANNQINLYENATITGDGPGNGNLDMNHDNGTKTIHALGSATISATIAARRDENCEIIVDEGKTLTVSSRIFGGYQITKKGAGTLKLTYPTGNTGTGDNSFTVPGVSAGTLEFAGSGTWNVNAGEVRDLSCYAYSGTGSLDISVTQTKAEYGCGGNIEVSGIPSGVSSITVNMKGGGASQVVPVSDGVATLTGSGDIVIDGEATYCDATFNGTVAMAYSQDNVVVRSPEENAAVYNNSDNNKTTGIMLNKTPWIGTTGSWNLDTMTGFQAAMTLAVVGQMSSVANTIFLHFGRSDNQKQGLLLCRTANEDEVGVYYNKHSAVTELTTMTVPNCKTTRHVYVITKQNGASTTTFTIYLDGIKWKTVVVNEVLNFVGGVQAGGAFGDNLPSTTYKKSTDAGDTGYVNCIRIYDRILTEGEIKKFSDASEYPYVSPNGSSSREFTASEENWIDTTESSEVWVNSGAADSGTPTAGASISVDARAATAITVNLDATTTYEALTVNGSSVEFVSGDGTGAIKVTGMTVIGTTVVNQYGAVDMTGGPMTITEDGDITFDYSAYDASAIYTATDIPLTSDVDEDNTKVHLISPTTPYRTYSLVYTSGHYAMRVTPDHEAGSDVYYKSGYWSSPEDTFSVTLNGTVQTAVFPNDTVVVDNKSSQNPMYFGASLPVNVAAIKIAKNIRISSGNTGGAAILGGATVAVADAYTLTIQRNSHNIKLGAVVLDKVGENGTGTVVLDANGGTITVSGAITGTAPIAIAENKSVTVAADGSIANTVELKSGSTLVVNSGATVGDVVTNVAHSRVVTSEEDGVKTYRVEEIPGTIFSVY